MDSELERLIDALIEETYCNNCATPILIGASQLNPDEDNLYTTDYVCPECEAEYEIKIKDDNALLKFGYTSTEENALEVALPFSKQYRKEYLQRQSHPVKDLVEGYTELNAALTLLWQNKKRIIEECNTIRERGINYNNTDFKRRVHADIHNYVASAYTFDEILKNVKPNLPTGGPVEDAIESYDDEKRVIIGLRVYAQHQFTIPFFYSLISVEGEDKCDRAITVQLEEVNSVDSDVNRNKPDGYFLGADHHYEKIEQDYINIEREINLHYEATEELVGMIAEYAEETHGEEIEEYQKVTDYTTRQESK